jgi:dihydroflavonol-4-reductase
METVLVTGASGHVGGNLVRELLRRGRNVRVLVHRNEGGLTGLEVERFRGDVWQPDSLRPAFAGVDVLYHLAAVISIDGDRGVVRRTNVEGVRNVMAAALESRVRRVVHMSSVHALMQEPLDAPIDESRARVALPGYPAYDRSKAEGEAQVRVAIQAGLDAVLVNPTGIIGPCDYTPSRMGRVFLDLYQGRLPALIEGGFDWVDVRDVVAGALAAEERGRTGENYLLSGHWHSIVELAAMARQVTGVRAPSFACPMWLARMGAPFVAAYARFMGQEPLFTPESLHALRANRCISREKAGRELGYAARPARETVADVYAWFLAEGVLSYLPPARAEVRVGA